MGLQVMLFQIFTPQCEGVGLRRGCFHSSYCSSAKYVHCFQPGLHSVMCTDNTTWRVYYYRGGAFTNENMDIEYQMQRSPTIAHFQFM